MPDLRTLRNFINGESVTSADGRTSEVISPVSGKAYATAPVSGAEDVDRAMKAAEAAFESWRETTPSQRQAALLKLADAMEAPPRAIRPGGEEDNRQTLTARHR